MHERQNPRNQRAVGVDNDVGLHLGDDFFCTLYCRQHAFAAREHPTRSGLYVSADPFHSTVQRVRGTDIRRLDIAKRDVVSLFRQPINLVDYDFGKAADHVDLYGEIQQFHVIGIVQMICSFL